MSQENVEIVREMITGSTATDSFLRIFLSPTSSCSTLASPRCRARPAGYEGLRQWREGVFEVVEEGQFEIDDLRDLDEADLVIYKIRLLGRARHTRLEIDIGWTNVNWFRDGRMPPLRVLHEPQGSPRSRRAEGGWRPSGRG